MTIAGQLEITASDDPRFVAGDSIGIVIDPGLVLTVTQAVEVSAPPTSSTSTPSSDSVGGGDTSAGADVVPVNPDSTPPATA